MIVHGLIDENVHFSHTTALIVALLKSVKPYQLQVIMHIVTMIVHTILVIPFFGL